jgi:hypothetical protein
MRWLRSQEANAKAYGILEQTAEGQAADRIDKLQDIIAKIQYTNLRRDINAKNRTIEIEKLCKTKAGKDGQTN